jgi:hypothetical protein
MMILITYRDPEDNSVRVSHGVDSETLQVIVLPNEPLRNFRAVFFNEIGEWVIL